MKKAGSRIYTFLIFLFLYAPILVLIVFSFNDTETASRTVWSGFSLKWYQKLFQDRLILEALRNTLIIAIAAAVASTVLGTMAAIGINSMKKLPRRIMMNVTNFPMVNPEICNRRFFDAAVCVRSGIIRRQIPGNGFVNCRTHHFLSALCDSFGTTEAQADGSESL